MTECVDCDRVATAFHGAYAYCSEHLEKAKKEEPEAHNCPCCQKTQPRHVLWLRRYPCSECQDQRPDDFLLG